MPSCVTTSELNKEPKYCPDISETTMERTLKQFLDSSIICKIGAGHGAAYCKA